MTTGSFDRRIRFIRMLDPLMEIGVNDVGDFFVQAAIETCFTNDKTLHHRRPAAPTPTEAVDAWWHMHAYPGLDLGDFLVTFTENPVERWHWIWVDGWVLLNRIPSPKTLPLGRRG